MKDLARHIAECSFTDHMLRTAGMSTRNREHNAKRLAPVEDALNIIPGGLLALLEEANIAGSSNAKTARIEAHNLLKKQGVYYWASEPGRTPLIGNIKKSAPIKGTNANVHVVQLFLEGQTNQFKRYDGLTIHEKDVLLDPIVFRHLHNINGHTATIANMANHYVDEISVAEVRTVFERTATIFGHIGACEVLKGSENNVLARILREKKATSFEEIQRLYENDSAMHEAQHYRDIDAHMRFGYEPNKNALEYGAYLVNLACSPLRQYLLATHVRAHYEGENDLTQGALTQIIDAYMESLDVNSPLDLLELDEKKIFLVAEDLLDEHYGTDSYCQCREYF